MDEKKYHVSSNPHVRDSVSTTQVMLAVVIALLPATVFGIYNFGIHAALVVIVSVGTSVLAEFLMCKILKRPVSVKDCSAIATGLLLALNLPPMFPLWMTAVGAVFAIVIVKMLFGGLGQNFMNPALAARCFLLISFAKYMTNFECDAYTGPTPLAILKNGGEVNVFDMVLGRTAGTIGETSMIAIILGACFLIALGIIDLRIPGMYILTFVVFILIFGKRGFDLNYVSAELAGGAGHMRRLQETKLLKKAVLEALATVENCTCGGESKHASCYGCLRNYGNQRLHDILDRSLAISYLRRILGLKADG